jgi:DNA repair photolyase
MTTQAISHSALWKKRLGDWVLNPYVGCEHGCFHCYCPSMPGVKFFNHGHLQIDWGKYIYEKPGFVDALKRQLVNFTPEKAKQTEWGDGWLLMSFLTDCYTPLEGKKKITRECLRLLLEAGHKVRIQTRSAMIERDFDILVPHRDRVLIGTSLPHLNDELTRALEPRPALPTRRLLMLKKAVDFGFTIYVAVAPFMPWDGPQQLDEVISTVAPLNPREIFCEVLNPKGDNIDMMRDALAKHSPKYNRELGTLFSYSAERWAAQTAQILLHGRRNSRVFVPWPDTGRGWSKLLPAHSSRALTQFLPTKEMELAA